ncbi:class A beta-lactamase [Nocardiopsis potens]|uniref:class A beta-lactamase n=1 Tax=Nocardiopsis potens TaxID=1246458 RepID=UPI00034CAE07|nr:class A beta-lactamase [Nocardiopsis potens]
MRIRFTRGAGTASLAALALAPLAACTGAGLPDGVAAEVPAHESTGAAAGSALPAGVEQAFAELEEEHDARLGVYAVDTGSEEEIAYQADERFAYCSTFKAMAVGALLREHPEEKLDEVVAYSEEDVIGYSPITEKHVDTGMTLRDIGDAAMRYSDNTAGNLLFEQFGGPKGLQAELREIGDETTSMDRYETELSEAVPGDERDTSTPRALAANLREYALGDSLTDGEQDYYTDLLERNLTGDALIRAGVPDGWKVGDKTGSGGYGTRNDIAVVHPPDGDPIVIAIMTSRDEKDAERREALVADAAEVVADTLG